MIYTRVSKDLREGRSVEEQETETRAWVDREGWQLVDVLSDNDLSASRYARRTRPDWRRLIDMIRSGDVDVVVFWELSRGIRNRRDWAEFAESAIDRGLLLCIGGRTYDATDPHDMEYLDSIVARAIGEVGVTRERILRTVTSRAEQGQPHGRPPFGLRADYNPETRALKGWVHDLTRWGPDGETPAGLVQEAAARILRGETPWAVAADWNQRGIPSPTGLQWARESVVTLLRSPAIMGKRSYKGRIVEAGGWAALVSQADWYRLQKILAPKRQQRARDADALHLCSGIFSCGECGARISTGKNGKVPSYRCVGRQPGLLPRGCVSRAIHVLDAQVEALVVAEFSAPDVLDRMLCPVDDQETREALLAEKSELEAELQQAREAAASTGPGRLPVAVLLSLEEGLGARIAELEERLREEPAVDPLLEQLAVPDPARVVEVWRGWSLTQRRRVLREYTTVARILRTGRTGPRPVPPSQSVEIRWIRAE